MRPPDAPGPLSRDVLREILGDSAAGVGIVDTDLRYVYVNSALARMNGLLPEEHIGRTVHEVLPGVDLHEELLRRILTDGEPRESTTSGHTRDADADPRYWHAVYHRLVEHGQVRGIVGIVLEISASRRQQRALETARERLALLDTAVSRIGTTLEIDTTCGELADFLVPALADVAVVEVFPAEQPDAVAATARPGGNLRLRRAAMASTPRLTEAMLELGGPGDSIEYPADSRAPRCMVTGRAATLNLASDEELADAAPDAARVAIYRALGLHSLVVLPLTARGAAPFGVLTMVRAGGSPPFTDEDILTAQGLADRAAISLDNARRYTREHGIALELQRALLSEPGSPHPSIEVACRYLPAGSSALIGGDWYDTIRLPCGRTLLAMGDVMGHGVEAAVDMSNYRSMLRGVGGADLPPHRVLRQLDAMIAESQEGRPATCLLALADPARGKLSYARAGHLPPALIGPDGRPGLLLAPGGPPLGTGYGGYELVTVGWRPGDVLLLYTDGLVEHRSEDIDVSLARLSALRLPAAGPLDELVDQVLGELVGNGAEDDVAVMAARIRPRP